MIDDVKDKDNAVVETADIENVENDAIADGDDSDAESAGTQNTAAYAMELKRKNQKLSQRLKEAKKVADELAKVAESLPELQKQTTELREKNVALENTMNNRVMNAEKKLLAKEFGLKKPEYLNIADLKNVKINEAGDVEGLREAFEELRKSDPDLFSLSTTGESNFGALNRPVVPRTDEDNKRIEDMSTRELENEILKPFH
ncbi:MAG: phage scaffolding protein [Pseudomonadota bacterium]